MSGNLNNFQQKQETQFMSQTSFGAIIHTQMVLGRCRVLFVQKMTLFMSRRQTQQSRDWNRELTWLKYSISKFSIEMYHTYLLILEIQPICLHFFVSTSLNTLITIMTARMHFFTADCCTGLR